MHSGRRGETDEGSPASDGDRVALLIDGADGDLVAAELDGGYRVLRTDGVPEAPFDLAVVDERGLATHGAALADRVAASEAFLPVLCLLPRRADPPPDVWERVDDVATRPLSRAELRARVDSLLRTRRLSVELHRRNERLERVGSVLAHDLRNPLAVASGYVDRAIETGDVGELDAAVDALDRVDHLVDDVLSLARHGAASLEVTPLSLARTARSAWDAVDTAGTDATLTLGDDLGTVEADESRLRELFENLFRNAVEHGADGPVRVTVDRLPNGGFSVADDGVGIPADARDEVFEQGYTTRREGTGLGLSIVSHIAALHGWRVSVEDGADGARFDVVPAG
ncbi:MAG: sensor histidine kinase [Haloferacaceae archaeon]